MATVESNKSITIMKYNNFLSKEISMSIRDHHDDNEIYFTDEDVTFLHKTLSKWIDEANEDREEEDE